MRHFVHRRGFMLASAGVALGASTSVGAAYPAAAAGGVSHCHVPIRDVVLTGWLIQPDPAFPHLYALVKRQPPARSLGATTQSPDIRSVRVFMARPAEISPGRQVRIRGDLQIGTFRDLPSGHVARAVMLNATPT